MVRFDKWLLAMRIRAIFYEYINLFSDPLKMLGCCRKKRQRYTFCSLGRFFTDSSSKMRRTAAENIKR